jgi:prevent-host-death family protein
MKTITAREANQSFSKWLGEAERGLEIVITRHGKRIATLKPYRAPEMTPERKAAVEHAIRIMEEGIPLGYERAPTREEIYDERIEELWARREGRGPRILSDEKDREER